MNPIAFPGDELRERREQLGLTPDDVFRKIRVPSQYLLALERGDFRALPSVSYTQGFLRTYCDFLGLDAPRYVHSFRTCVRPAPNRFLGMARDAGKPLPDWAREFLAWCAICGILALCWFAYTVVVQPNADAQDGRVQAGTVELVLPSDDSIPAAK